MTALRMTTAAMDDLAPPSPTATGEAGGPCGAMHSPRCGTAVNSGAREPGPCACDAVALTDAHRHAMAARHVGCLCPACLRAVAAGAPA